MVQLTNFKLSLIKEKHLETEVLFIHCFVHRFNLEIHWVYKKDIKYFFKRYQDFLSFFTKSSNKSNALDREVNKRLPIVCHIKWNYISRMSDVIYKSKKLSRLFKSMGEDRREWESKTRACVSETCELEFQYFTWSVFYYTPKVWRFVQYFTVKKTDISYCKKKICNYVHFVHMSVNC